MMPSAAARIWPRVYNALWYPILPFALLAAGGYHSRNLRERLGKIGFRENVDVNASMRMWVHAASVGEIEAVRPILAGLSRSIADSLVAVTTMTPSGRDAAMRRLGTIAAAQLSPLDCAAIVRRFLDQLRPHLVIVAETELWPNLFIQSADSGAKVAIVNGRISERSMRRYINVRPLIRAALRKASLILAQTAEDAARFRELGAPEDRIIVTGNTKFDLLESPPPLRPALANFAAGRPILVAGSTARGEERLVLTAYRNLVERFPAMALVIAPRHLQRAFEVEEELLEAGLPYVRARALPPARSNVLPAAISESVLLLDTMGELRAMYQRATIAFVGGSILPGRGGQSLAEPAAAGVPVLFGPHYETQREAGDALLETGGGRVVADTAQLESTCAEWLTDDALRTSVGERALAAIERLGGGTTESLRHLTDLASTCK